MRFDKSIFAYAHVLQIAQEIPSTARPVVIDTDIFSDVDDVGALAIANVFHNCGLADLRAVMINTQSGYGAVAANTINTYFRNPSIPIAALRPLTNDTFLDIITWKSSEFASKLAHNFPHPSLDSAASTPEPVEQYLSVLTAAESKSMTIISLGHLTNLYDFLHHDLPLAQDLLGQKVRELVIMGGGYPEGKEFNLSLNVSLPRNGHGHGHAGASENVAAYVLAHLPPSVPVTFLGVELGAKVISGGGLRHRAPEDSPVRAAYEWYVGRCGTERESWDPLTVVYGVLGLDGLDIGDSGMFEFGNEGGFNSIDPFDGSNAWVYDGGVKNQHWLKLTPGVSEKAIGTMLTRFFAWDPDSGDCRMPAAVHGSKLLVQY